MKKTVSVLLSALMLFLCIPFGVFAQEGSDDIGGDINCAAIGRGFGSGEATEEYAKILDEDFTTFWQAAADDDYVGFDLSKDKNGKINSVSVYVSAPDGVNVATYKVQYFRNNRWYDLFTFTDSDTEASGTASVSVYKKELDAPVITQKLRVVISDTAGDTAMPKVYELSADGIILENIARKGKAYASSFKHFDWTPPTSGNDGNDFDEDWRGWEPKYPDVTPGTDTSNGFSGEYWGIEFVNKEYYEISELVFYMSLHNSYAEPAMGYQNTKYKVEALCEGEWIVIAEFSDSDALPNKYDSYDDAMANDTGAHHIPAFYTKVLETPVTTNNIRVTVNEFAKNYQGVERLVFPYIYELRAYGVKGEAPDIELPEGARYSTDATSNGIPYATSSASNKYPLLAIDDDYSTGWAPSQKTAGQTYGVQLDRIYTVNDIYLVFANSSINAPFKVEALVDGQWIKLLDGNVTDATESVVGGGNAKGKIYSIDQVMTNEIRVVFTSDLTDVPEIMELSSNILSSIVSFVSDNEKVEAVKNGSGKYAGINLNSMTYMSSVELNFAADSPIKYFVQVSYSGLWQTVAAFDSIEAGSSVVELGCIADSIRITYSNEGNAPAINSMTLSTLEDTGHISSVISYSFDFTGNGSAKVDVDFGKLYLTDRINVDVDGQNISYEYIGEDDTHSFDGSIMFDENTRVKGVSMSLAGASIPKINDVEINIVGLKTFFLTKRYTNMQTISASRGNLSILGTAYANSNYPAMSYETFINDGRTYLDSPTWVPKLEEYSSGKEIYCGIKFHKEYAIDTIAVYAADIGNLDGIGNSFEIQALVNGEYKKIADGNTCAGERNYLTVYKVDPVTTSDVRLVFTNSSIYIPTIIELEIFSGNMIPSPFDGYPISFKTHEVTVFKSETPRFEVAGLPK